MSKPKPTKRLATTRLDQLVMVRDESVEQELLAFENLAAAWMFEACLADSGYGSAYTLPDMGTVRKTAGYKKWLADGQQVISLAYMQHVSDCMYRDEECDVSSDLLNMGTVGAAYAVMNAAGDWGMLFPDECEEEDDEDETEECEA
jgi:hypothetical protein